MKPKLPRNLDIIALHKRATTKIMNDKRKEIDPLKEVLDEGFCPNREDLIHCIHWWEGLPCCNCGEDKGEIYNDEDERTS